MFQPHNQSARAGNAEQTSKWIALLQLQQLIAQNLTEPAKLGVALVLQAELEGLLGDHPIHLSELDIVAQNLQDIAVCLPQEFEPWSHQFSVCAVLARLIGHIAQHQILWASFLIQIINFLNHSLHRAGPVRAKRTLSPLMILVYL
jgi:hypothetical protein